MAKKCSGCGADVEWVTTTANRKMPLNLGPALDGNIILTEAGRAQALGPIELAALPPGTVRRMSHFAACPDAGRFRAAPASGRGRK